jgi:hypothetical protein
MMTIEVEPDQAIAIVNALWATADALASLPMPAGAGPDYWTEQSTEHRRLADSILTRVSGADRPTFGRGRRALIADGTRDRT